MRSLLWLWLLLSICVLPSSAETSVPDPSQCETTLDPYGRLYLCPDGLAGDCLAATFDVIVRDHNGDPYANAFVQVLINGESTGHIRLCADQELSGAVGPDGWIQFNIAGGGCHKGDNVCEIRANGVTIRQFDVVVSADYAGFDDTGFPDRSDLHVDPIDLAAFASAYQGGTGLASCHDYDNDGTTGPTDLATFASAYMGGANYCDSDR